VVEQRWIKELDINPLLASAERLIALDARVVLHPPDTKEEALPRLAIRPYPTQYVSEWHLKDGSPVIIRPIRAEDETLIAKLHETLSDESVYSRFFRFMPLSRRIAHERLSRICFVDYDNEIGLVVEYNNPTTHEFEILGVGRLIKLVNRAEAEFSVLVSDAWQGQGIGSKLLEMLVEVGRQENLSRIVGTILPENYGMQRVARKVGFAITRSIEDRLMVATFEL
jgi:acetyltransferase